MGEGVRPYTAEDLTGYATGLLLAAGLPGEPAEVTAKYLVEADLMGHVTHGLNLLPSYLSELESGLMTKTGDPLTVSDRGAAVLQDGRMLPGIWLTWMALTEACRRLERHPVVTWVIRKSHHIGALAAFLPEIASRGILVTLSCSDPSSKLVAPFGGRIPLYTPNPIAMGIPTGSGKPIIIDVSTSVTALGVVNRHRKQKKRLPGMWLLDAEGNPTDDPEVIAGNPHGSILPLGGLDVGYKGFALGLSVEAMTSGLGGYGRAEKPKNWGASVFIQVTDPDAFGGREAFEREMGWLADRSRENPPRPGSAGVRLPGERALTLRRRQLEEGVSMETAVMDALKPWAEKLGVKPPAARRA